MAIRKMPIELDYCRNWSVQDALREFLQNAIDTKTPVKVDHMGDFAIIQDQSTGIMMQDFILGRTSKRYDDQAIGQFGEGLTIGCLVLARAGRSVKILSKDYSYRPKITYDKIWGDNILAFKIEKTSETTRGTTVYAECTEEELQEALNLFLQFNPKPILDSTATGDILDSPGNFYVNGVKVTTGDSIYGYNFRGMKSIINRDRGSIDHKAIISAISSVLSNTENIDVIKNLLKLGSDPTLSKRYQYLELNIEFQPRTSAWSTAIKEQYGDKVCLHRYGNTLANNFVKALGWVPLQMTWHMCYMLATNGLLKYSDTIAQDFAKVIVLEPTSNELSVLERATEICQQPCQLRNLNTHHKTQVVEFPDEAQLGSADIETNTINISKRALRNVPLAVQVLLHERVHLTTGYPDYSTEFEAELVGGWADLAVATSEKEE